MSEQDKREAKEHAERAGTQAKHAAKNTGRAAKAAASAAADKAVDVGEDFYDAAKDKAPSVIEGTKEVAADVADVTEDAAKYAGRKARRFNPWGLASVTNELGQGTMALTVALWAGTIAFNKYSAAFHKRARIVNAAHKANHHIRPSGEVR